MNRAFRALLLPLAIGIAGPLRLPAQSIQYRAKVSDQLHAYAPKIRIRSALEIHGADSLTDLGEEWNRTFRRFHPEGQLVYVPTPTKDAIKELTDGTRSIIIAARELTPEESQAFRGRFGYLPMRVPVVLDALIVFVHKSNPLSAISMEQLDAIYSKDRKGGAKEPLHSWGELNVRGDLSKRSINAYAREDGNASRGTFAGLALAGGDFRPGLVVRNDYASLAESILTDLAGIAFGPMSTWYSANKILPVVPYEGRDARLPNQDMVTSSRYPMAMWKYVYVNRAPGKPLDPAVDEFLHFALSREGQDVVADVGLFPAPLEFLTIALKRLDR